MGTAGSTANRRRVTAVVFTALGCAAAFAAALCALLLYANLAVARRVALRELNGFLTGQFKGTFAIERLATLRIDEVGGLDVRVVAPNGTNVIVAKNVHARLHPVALLKSLVVGGGLDIDVYEIEVGSLDVNLDAEDDGRLELEAAFETRKPSSVTGNGPTLHLAFDDVSIRSASVHGRMKGIVPIDTDLENLRGSVRVDGKTVSIDATQVALVSRGMPGGADPLGAVQARVVVPSKTGHSAYLSVSFDGTVGGISAAAKGTFDGERVDAGLDVPPASAERIRELVPQAPVYQPLGARVDVHGELGHLRTSAHITIGRGLVDAAGELALAGTFAATFGIDFRNFDLRALSPAAPSSSLALHTDVRIDTTVTGALEGHFHADATGGQIGQETVPPGSFEGDFAETRSPDGTGHSGVNVQIDGRFSEPGAPIQLHASLRSTGGPPLMTLDATSHVANLSAVRRLAGLGQGSGQLTLKARALLGEAPSFDARLLGGVEGFERPSVRIDRARFDVYAHGSFARPDIDASLEADGLRLARYRFRDARLTATGPLFAEQVAITLRSRDTPSLRAVATLALSPVPTLRNVVLDVIRGPQAMHAEVGQIRVDSAGVAVERAEITGIGEPIHASLDTRRGLLNIQGSSGGIDLGALSYLLRLEDKVTQGRLAFAVDLAARNDGAEGSATADLNDGRFSGIDGIRGHFEARMEGRRITGAMQASAGALGTLDVSRMHLEMAGKGPLEVSSWRRTWGLLRIDGQIDLAKAFELLPPDTLPLSKLAGRLTLEGHIRRDNELDVTPDVALTLKTSGLRIAGLPALEAKANPATQIARPPWEFADIDVGLDVRADGDSGFAEVSGRLLDPHGALVSLDAKSARVPYQRLFASSLVTTELLEDIPFSAVVVIPPRKIDQLPDIIRPAGASGDAEARISIDGTCRAPVVDLTAKARALKFDGSFMSGRLDADVTAKYADGASDVIVDARTSRSGLLHASVRVNADAASLLAVRDRTFPWNASAKATFTHFPLGSIGALSDRQVRGQIDGHVELADLHRDAHATIDLDLNDLHLGDETFEAGKVTISVDGRSLDASAHIERKGTSAGATAKVGTIWGAALGPSVDPSGTSDVSFQATHFPAAVLAPLAEGVVDALEGTIDADVRFAMRPHAKPHLEGELALRDGVVELTALGQQIHGIGARLIVTPGGIVRLENLSAYGTTGKLVASGTARLDGWSLAGTQAVLSIEKGEAMPFALQGSSLGTAYGQFNLTTPSAPDERTQVLRIDVPSLHVELPDASTRAVQRLDESRPQTHVGVYLSHDGFVALPLDRFDAQEGVEGTPKASVALTVDVHLGQDVEVRRGTDLKVELDGDLSAKIGDPTQVTGQIRLKGGKLAVQGKSFEIESGTVTFHNDASNPEIRATSTWTAGDGTRVFADYVGPLKTGKVILRSEPARPQNEILALILFGSANGLTPTSASAGQQQDATTQTGTAVGAFAAAGLNKGINKLTGMEITATLDTSSASPRPEVAVQIARDVSLQLAVVLGTLPFGMNQDTTYATIDWRFFKDWSLETTFGNLGTSIANVVWQHRY